MAGGSNPQYQQLMAYLVSVFVHYDIHVSSIRSNLKALLASEACQWAVLVDQKELGADFISWLHP
jgi:hypothetical protein